MILLRGGYPCSVTGSIVDPRSRVLDVLKTAEINTKDGLEETKIDRHDNEIADVRLRRQ
jgi:hypothetical protein